MKKSFLILIPILFIVLASFKSDNIPNDRIYWLTYEEVIKASEKTPKKVFIDVYTDWCGWCKRMDQTTFKDPKIINLLNDDYYAVKLDAESDKSFEYNGKTMTYRQLARSFQATAYPTTVYLNEDLTLIQAVPGYQQPNSLEMILSYFGGNHHTKTTWPEYQKQYQSDSN